MCGRFAQVIVHEDLQKLVKELNIKETDEQIEINYNLAPTQTTAAIVAKDTLRYIGYFRWGLIPSWSREIGKFNLINVRSETIHEKPTFKSGLARRRCLIPANGFYEWREGDKTPFYIHPAQGDLLFFAGIYDTWTDPEGSFIPSCSIITTESNPFMRSIHQRMPVILSGDGIDAWLNPANTDPKLLDTLLKPCADDLLKRYPVSKFVNNIRNNSPACLQALPQDELFA